ncbi:DNA protecting protein DprA [Gordonibacter sp. An230]|uniref:DNA-processing protein DprA n=1 Tax=Gordonibacter sp. An230 TaxID=1965592 RepID=UPI000B3ACF69|nr:DNA-processing protein DprA [Gordonibacter sp. An230]OUO90754.1 DNA protecting protein DprA [Gordonibacter sp. An230]
MTARSMLEGPRSVLVRGSDAYPTAFEALADPPAKLYVIGDLASLSEGMAIVGARRATPYGRGCAMRFARLAAERGVTVISGGARGCDAAAHEAALSAGGRTTAFLGGGCDRLYPAEHRGLFQRIVDGGGAVVSEHPWDVAPRPWMFRLRNRLIAALARATLIVEAGLPSGTFSTADEALAVGREVLVVPGAITAATSRGANRLLVQGAAPIVDDESFEDALLSLFGCLRQERFAAEGSRRAVGEGGEAVSEKAAGDAPSKLADGSSVASSAPMPDPLVEALRADALDMDALYELAVGLCEDADPRAWLMERLVAAERSHLIAKHPDGRWGPAG